MDAESGDGFDFMKARVRRELPAVIAAYRAGASLGQLADHFRCSKNPIRAVLVAAGVEVRSAKGWSTDDARHGRLAIRRHLGARPGRPKADPGA